MNYVICMFLGYFVGTINPSYLFALKKGFDIRERGSGNAGASNAVITMGKDVGILCILLDILKAYGIVKFATYIFADSPYSFVITASACILGHIFPFYMKFRGGKGLACMGGSLLAYSPVVFFKVLIVGAIFAFLVGYICVLPISASILLPVLYGFAEKDLIGMNILMFVGVIIIWKHKENIIRIKNGSELRLSYIWNKEKEIERVMKASDNDDNQEDKRFVG
jgi:glycerol-3-phosphate acyltransferase PlsY